MMALVTIHLHCVETVPVKQKGDWHSLRKKIIRVCNNMRMSKLWNNNIYYFSWTFPLTQHAYKPGLYCSEYRKLSSSSGGFFHWRFERTILTSWGGFKQNVHSEIKQTGGVLSYGYESNYLNITVTLLQFHASCLLCSYLCWLTASPPLRKCAGSFRRFLIHIFLREMSHLT